MRTLVTAIVGALAGAWLVPIPADAYPSQYASLPAEAAIQTDESDDPRLKEALRKHLERSPRDYLALERDLAEIGATGLRVSAAGFGESGATAEQAQQHATSNEPGSVRATAQDPSECQNPSYQFSCELLLFHDEGQPPEQPKPPTDYAILTFDFNNLYGPDSSLPWAGEPDDVAAITFEKYDQRCYEAPQDSRAAWGAKSLTDENWDTPVDEWMWRAKIDSAGVVYHVQESQWAIPHQPAVDHGYVLLKLKHKPLKDKPSKDDCPKSPDSAYKELRAAGTFEHNKEGSGTWSASIGWGAFSISYSGMTPKVIIPKSTGVLTLHPNPGGTGGPGATRLAYSGPTQAPYHAPFTASARLTASPEPGTEPSDPVRDAPVTFTLGIGGGSQTCTGITNQSGVASCVLTAAQRPGQTTLAVRYAGDGYSPSKFMVPFTITRQETAVTYTGPKRIANGTSAHLSGVLTEKNGPPVSGRPLTLALGAEESRQACTGTTDSSGTARCTLQTVNQPLNESATVPATVTFDGDDYYLPSKMLATLLLEHYTGRAYGVKGSVNLPLVPIGVAPTPDTGTVRTAQASNTTTPCVIKTDTPIVSSKAMCPKVTTALAPGTSRSTSTVERTTISIPGVPLVDIRGATASSTSTCGSEGSASGSTDLTLYVAGEQITVPAEPNSKIDLPGGVRLLVNEQTPVKGAEHGLTVNAIHLTALGGVADIVIASATSDVHNCAS